jgi:hypothetical protein
MKQSPQMQKLEEMLRSSKLVAGGFMGSETRGVMEVIDADNAEVSMLGQSVDNIALRMLEITKAAIKGLGTWVDIDKKRRAKVDEAKGFIICPWPHPARFAKRVTTLELIHSGRQIFWSDLSIHLIAEHGFFEGKGAAFRVEPAELIKMIF